MPSERVVNQPPRQQRSDVVPAIASSDQIISVRQCCVLTNLSRTTIWRLEQAQEFPRRRRISKNRVGFRLGTVLDWLRSREKSPYKPGPPA